MNGNCGECEFRWYCVVDPAVCENMTKHVMTNADKIRAMTDEKLAAYISENIFCPEPFGKCYAMDCKSCALKWLQKPAEVDHAEE